MTELLDPFSDDAVRRMLEWLLAREYDLTGVSINAVIDGAR
jgi:hypothetical protein